MNDEQEAEILDRLTFILESLMKVDERLSALEADEEYAEKVPA